MAASSDAVGAVVRLLQKGIELHNKDCFARAVEKFSQAVVTSQALQLPHHNLVVAHAQALHACTLSGLATMSAGVQPADARSAHQQAFEEVLPAVEASLQRRRAAGTLFSLSAGEDAFYRVFEAAITHEPGQGGNTYGYEAFLRAANMALYEACWCLVGRSFPLRDAALLQQHLMFAAEALDLMHLPAVCAFNFQGMEAAFVQMVVKMQQFDWLHEQPHDGVGRAFHVLRAPWLRLQRSGVLEARHLIGKAVNKELEEGAHADELRKAARIVAQGGLRACALASCGAHEAHAAHFKRCAGCKAVVYCCKAHQAEHWPAHKAACKAARKAAGEGGASHDA